MLKERWKWIPGFKGLYKASTYGRIKSVGRFIEWKGQPVWKPAKYLSTKSRNVCLRKNGEYFQYRIANLVLLTFVGPCPEGMECCHWDDNWKNNHIDNIRWDTHHNNMLDLVRNGKSTRGERNGQAKFTNKQVANIRKFVQINGRGSQRTLSRKMNVTESVISEIVRGISYKEN